MPTRQARQQKQQRQQALALEFERHGLREKAHRCLVDLVLSAFGVASRGGRCVDHFRFMNPQEIIHTGLGDPWLPASWLPTQAARSMKDRPEPARMRRRRQPVSSATAAVMQAYVEERIGLLEAAEPIAVRASIIRCHLRRSRRLLECLQSPGDWCQDEGEAGRFEQQ